MISDPVENEAVIDNPKHILVRISSFLARPGARASQVSSQTPTLPSLAKGSERNLFVFAFILVLVAILMLVGLKTRLDADRGTVLVDMVVNASESSNMWVNDQSQQPKKAKLQPDVRKVYEFTGLTDDIRYMRLDPVPGINGATVRIYSIQIRSPSGDKERLGPGEISKWQVFNGRRVNLTDDYIEYVSMQNIILTSEAQHHLQLVYPEMIHSIANVVFDLGRFNIIMSLCFLCLMFSALWTRSWAHIGIVSGLIVGMIALSRYVALANFGSVSVAKAVGLASFSGHSLMPNSMFSLMSSLLAVSAAGAAYFLYRGRSPTVDLTRIAFQQRFHWWQWAALFLFVTAVIFPNVLDSGARHAIMWGGMYVPQWDSDNAVTWAYMIRNGYLPFRDFWYPYGLSFAFDFAAPWGNFLQWIVLSGLFVTFFYLISVVTRSAYLVGSILIAAFLLGGFVSQNVIIFPQPERHLFPFVICLAYIVADRSPGPRPLWIWPFWLTVCVCLLFEPSQVAYAAPAIALVLLFDVFWKTPIQLKALIWRLARDFAFPMLFLGLMILILYLTGVLQNVSDFYLEMGSIANYMAVPTSLDLSFGNITDRSFFLVAGPFIVLALGIYERTLAVSKFDLLPKAMIAAGAIGVMQLQKHGVRPLDWAPLYSSATGIVLYSILLKRRMGHKSTLLFGGMVGLTASVFLTTGAISQCWTRLTSFGQRVVAAVDVVNMEAKERAAYRSEQFSTSRLKAFVDETQLLTALKSRVGQTPVFYSMPDAPMLYVIAGVKPPYQINGFSMSPIFEQAKMVRYLRSKQVEYVIVEPSKINFDGFAYYIRLPLLYNYVVNNYVFDFATPRFSAFRHRKPGEPISLESWISVLGTDVNLGHLPIYADSPDPSLRNCKFDCVDMLRVTTAKVMQEQPVTIPFLVGGKALEISFTATPGRRDYWIQLNRIWFWSSVDSVSAAQLGKDLPQGLSVEILRTKRRSPEHLY